MDTSDLRSITCCFTGHRPNKLPWKSDERHPLCIDFRSRISDIIYSVWRSGYLRFLCGMARGADLIFCEEALKLRSDHPEIRICAIIPCEEQTESWPLSEKKRYTLLSSQCDEQIVLQKEYTPDCMQKRNRFMVDNSSLLIAAYNGSHGGTMQTMLLARRGGLSILEIKP